ncbi:MAG TPA: patatin-like phospholipase family protein [Oscillatoriaceae cyanobacterium]
MGKIGLVLSGGVAKGSYEAGVLRALAEREIVPDVIVGVSAGALNGAMATGMIVDDEFTPARVESGLIDIYRERVSFSHFFESYDPDDTFQDLDRKSLNNLARRFGIDPFNKVWLPTRWDPQALKTLEYVLRGNFISMFSHAYFRQLAHDFVFPTTIKRAVKFSAVVCNLMGETSLSEDDEHLEARWSHNEDFHWYPNMPRTENFIQYNRLIDVIMASSSFPLAFPPMRLSLDGGEKPGLFIDGGMTDNAPIGKAITMDHQVDTVFAVMATTIVPPPAEEPDNILAVFNRMSEILAGRFIINNYHKVLKVNRRLQALARVLERDSEGVVKPSEFNENLAIAAGFANLDDYLSRRVVRVIPVFPSTPLKGDLFAGFRDPKLLCEYMDLGYADACDVLTKRLQGDEDESTWQSLRS